MKYTPYKQQIIDLFIEHSSCQKVIQQCFTILENNRQYKPEQLASVFYTIEYSLNLSSTVVYQLYEYFLSQRICDAERIYHIFRSNYTKTIAEQFSTTFSQIVKELMYDTNFK